jgi:hypothetical protein
MRLSQARTVLSHSRDVAMEIIAGTKFLDKEYATAKKRTVQSDAVRGKKPRSSKRKKGRSSLRAIATL